MLSRRPRVPRVALPGLVLALALGLPLGLPPGAASASDTSGGPGQQQACEAGSVADAAKSATAVFTGTVAAVGQEEISAQETEYTHTMTVDRVYKPGRGSVIDAEEVELLTQQAPDGCSLGGLTQGERYVVFADLSGATLLATGDGGTTVADDALVAEVEQLLGTGRPPVPPEPPTAQLTPVRTGTPVTFVRAAVPGAVLVLVGLVGLLVTRRLGRPD